MMNVHDGVVGDDGFELAAIRAVLAGHGQPSDAARERARVALTAAIDAGPDRSGDRVRRGSRRRVVDGAAGRWRALVPALGLGTLACAVAVALLVSQVAVRGGAGDPQAAAAAVLEKAAQAALATSPTTLKPGQYWYEENRATYLDGGSTKDGSIWAYVSEDERWWVGSSAYRRTDRLRSIRAAEPMTHAWQRQAMREFGPNPSISGHDDQYDLPITYERLLHAPTTVVGMRQFLAHGEDSASGAFTDSDAIFMTIHDIVIEPRVPGRVLATILRTAATVPGIRLSEGVKDSLGRETVAITYTNRDQSTRYEMMFDPVNFALLDERDIDIHTGQTEADVAYIRAGVVDRLGATPSNAHAVTK